MSQVLVSIIFLVLIALIVKSIVIVFKTILHSRQLEIILHI